MARTRGTASARTASPGARNQSIITILLLSRPERLQDRPRRPLAPALDEGHIVDGSARRNAPPPGRVAQRDDGREHPAVVGRHAQTRQDLGLMARETSHRNAAESGGAGGELKTPYRRVD